MYIKKSLSESASNREKIIILVDFVNEYGCFVRKMVPQKFTSVMKLHKFRRRRRYGKREKSSYYNKEYFEIYKSDL